MPAWEAGEHQPIRATLAQSAERLARADAGFFACPDNTAHLALEQPGDPLALPGLHIAQVAVQRPRRRDHVLQQVRRRDGQARHPQHPGLKRRQKHGT